MFTWRDTHDIIERKSLPDTALVKCKYWISKAITGWIQVKHEYLWTEDTVSLKEAAWYGIKHLNEIDWLCVCTLLLISNGQTLFHPWSNDERSDAMWWVAVKRENIENLHLGYFNFADTCYYSWMYTSLNTWTHCKLLVHLIVNRPFREVEREVEVEK